MSVFVSVDRRKRSQPQWAVALLVCTCVLCFVLFALESAREELAQVQHFGVIPARLFNPARPWLEQGLNPAWWHLLSGLFIHVTWLHLLGNLLFLLIFGIPTERTLGGLRFLLLFLLGGVFANLMGVFSLPGVYSPIIGCSGAVSAVVGTYIALFPRARLGLVVPLGLYFEFVRLPAWLLIGIWVLLQLSFSYLGASYGAVAWWTHIAGFLFGIAFALACRPGIARRLRQ